MPGTVTFSIEVELGWGLVQYDKLDGLSPGRKAETRSLGRLLELCDELEIPMTFDVVGHLLLDGPLPSYDGGHERGWFDDIPRTSVNEDPEFYAPDLVDRIQSAAVDHEICTHTFSHVECANASRETLRWEFDKVVKTHKEYGLDRPVSLVPPRHSPPPRDILREYGIEIVRSPRSRAPNASAASNRLQLARDIFTGSQPISRPKIADGVVETYGTRYPSLTSPFLACGQLDPHPIFKAIPEHVRKRLHARNANRALSKAIEYNSFYNSWTHLWETANDEQWPLIAEFLETVATKRDTGDVQVRTMEEVNTKVRS